MDLQYSDADYEAELNEFRRQLEADRQALNAEIDQLRVRNQELTEAARQAELELSRAHVETLDKASAFDIGYPYDFIGASSGGSW